MRRGQGYHNWQTLLVLPVRPLNPAVNARSKNSVVWGSRYPSQSARIKQGSGNSQIIYIGAHGGGRKMCFESVINMWRMMQRMDLRLHCWYTCGALWENAANHVFLVITDHKSRERSWAIERRSKKEGWEVKLPLTACSAAYHQGSESAKQVLIKCCPHWLYQALCCDWIKNKALILLVAWI